MTKFRLLIVGSVVSASIIVLGTPALLKAIPSRYVAAYVPEPIQNLALPADQAPILPTIAMPADAEELLEADNGGPNEERLEPILALASPTPPGTDGGPLREPPSPPAPSPTTVPARPTATPTPFPLPATARLEGFRHEFQGWNNCGPATLAMTLSFFGLSLTQANTADYLKPDPEDRNVSPYEMVGYVNNQTAFQALDRVNGDRELLRRFVANGIPVIIEIGIEPPGEYRWLGWYGHYLLVVAYDDLAERFWVYDSWFGTSDVPMENAHQNGRTLTYATLEEDWPHFNRSYIAVFRPEQAALVAEIIGPDMDDQIMWNGALATVRADAAADPDNPFNWFNLGTVYNALEQYENAATSFDQARAIGLPWRMLWYQFGPYEAYYRVGRFEDVVLLADVTLKDRPYFEESYYYKGLALAAMGDTENAQQNLAAAVAFNPLFDPAAAALAEMADIGG